VLSEGALKLLPVATVEEEPKVRGLKRIWRRHFTSPLTEEISLAGDSKRT